MRRTIVLTSLSVVLLVSTLVIHALAQEGAPTRKTAATPTRYTCPMHPQVKLAQAGKCPMCGMALINPLQQKPRPMSGCCGGGMMRVTPKTVGGKTVGQKEAKGPEGMMQLCMSMMQKAGMTPDMMRRCRIMMQTPIAIDSPSVLRGQAEALGLSEDQKKQLAEIEKEARKKALAVLTPEQCKKMGAISDKPMPMMQMCQQMCSKMMSNMHKMMGDKR